MATLRPFHLAFPVDDLTAARLFYGDILGCGIGRSSDEWIDFDFYGHQIVAHLSVEEIRNTAAQHNDVDAKKVPVRHFGVILDKDKWQVLSARLEAAKVDFLIAPYIRFAGETGEQGTFFISDPSGNGLEFKYFDNDENIFAADALS